MLDEAIEYLKSLQLQVQVSDRDSDLALSSPLLSPCEAPSPY